MKLLVLILALAMLLCGCADSKREDKKENKPDTTVAAEDDRQESEIISDFVYYCGTAGTSSDNDNIFLHPYKDGFVCLNYDFFCGNYEKIKGMLLTQEEQEQFLEQLEAGVTPTERYDSDEDGGSFREFAICFGDEEQIIEALDLSFLSFEELSEKYSYDDMESSYERAQNLFSLSEETMEKLGRYDSEFLMPTKVVIVFMANQIADHTGERIDSAEEVDADEEHFQLQVRLKNDETLLVTVTYTGLIVEWESV